MKFEGFTAVTVNIIVFRDVMCCLADVYRCFSETSVDIYQAAWRHLADCLPASRRYSPG
jgi:hypothetical protein